MAGGLTPSQSRMAALAVMAVMAVALYGLVVAPIYGAYTNYFSSISDLEHRLEQYTRIAQSRPQLEAQLGRLTERPPSDEDFLTGDSDAITAADLQRVVTEIIQLSRGRLISAQVLDPESGDGLTKIGLSIQLDGDIQSLQRVLFAIESGKPVLFIDTLDVRASPATVRRRGQPQTGPVTLRAQLDFFGYRLDDDLVEG